MKALDGIEPPYFRSKDAPGAHINIFYVDENIQPEEVGQTFQFELKNSETYLTGGSLFLIQRPHLILKDM